ncbi:2Fe-2S iron-sulfur cluster-binding protein [Paraburkholderia silvatlantica]|uniref:2Fe-2S iron-sulfur cluster-binding protein n=1 Tax=Paraburkholderia silvatlantica TaxID=321895 RepID=UPI003CC81C6F
MHLNHSDRTVLVPAGKRLLDTLLVAGVECEYSCGEGICGACETTVLEGTPEDRTSVLCRARTQFSFPAESVRHTLPRPATTHAQPHASSCSSTFPFVSTPKRCTTIAAANGTAARI